MSSASSLLSAPVIVVPRPAGGLVRALVDDAASPATAPDGGVLGKVRQEPPPPARGGRALFLAVSVLVGNPHTARDPAFAVEAADGPPLLRLLFSGHEVSVHDEGGAELGVLVARSAPLDEHSVRTEILGDAPVLRTLLTAFACSLVMPEWIDRPRSSSGGGG